jgi:hypothetical protein
LFAFPTALDIVHERLPGIRLVGQRIDARGKLAIRLPLLLWNVAFERRQMLRPPPEIVTRVADTKPGGAPDFAQADTVVVDHDCQRLRPSFFDERVRRKSEVVGQSPDVDER